MKLICGDSLEKMKEMEPNSVDSVVTDPPYGLNFMGKQWDHRVPGKECRPSGLCMFCASPDCEHRSAIKINTFQKKSTETGSVKDIKAMLKRIKEEKKEFTSAHGEDISLF